MPDGAPQTLARRETLGSERSGGDAVEVREEHWHLGERSQRVVEVRAAVRLRQPLEHDAAQLGQRRPDDELRGADCRGALDERQDAGVGLDGAAASSSRRRRWR